MGLTLYDMTVRRDGVQHAGAVEACVHACMHAGRVGQVPAAVFGHCMQRSIQCGYTVLCHGSLAHPGQGVRLPFGPTASV